MKRLILMVASLAVVLVTGAVFAQADELGRVLARTGSIGSRKAGECNSRGM